MSTAGAPVRTWDEMREVFRRAVELSGLPPRELDYAIRGHRRDPIDLLEEMLATPDARDRLVKLHTEALERVAVERENAATATLEAWWREMKLPAALLAVDDARARKLVTPLLWRFYEKYNPDRDGGAIVSFATGDGKTLGAVRMICRNMRERAQVAAAAALQTPDKQKGNHQGESYGSTSFLSACVSRAVGGFVWSRATDLAAARSNHPLGQGEAPAVTEAMDARALLVIDDLGQEPELRPTAPNILFEILDVRYSAGSPTLITTGLSPEELTNRYGGAFIRRVLQSGGRDNGILCGFDEAQRNGR